jgi:hypothetical protein
MRPVPLRSYKKVIKSKSDVKHNGYKYTSIKNDFDLASTHDIPNTYSNMSPGRKSTESWLEFERRREVTWGHSLKHDLYRDSWNVYASTHQQQNNFLNDICIHTEIPQYFFDTRHTHKSSCGVDFLHVESIGEGDFIDDGTLGLHAL